MWPCGYLSSPPTLKQDIRLPSSWVSSRLVIPAALFTHINYKFTENTQGNVWNCFSKWLGTSSKRDPCPDNWLKVSTQTKWQKKKKKKTPRAPAAPPLRGGSTWAAAAVKCIFGSSGTKCSYPLFNHHGPPTTPLPLRCCNSAAAAAGLLTLKTHCP